MTMARSAATHSQNSAPGPPVAIAVATPDILDTPTVPPIAMENRLKWRQTLAVVSTFLTTFFAEHIFDDMSKVTELEKSGADRQIDSCYQNCDQ